MTSKYHNLDPVGRRSQWFPVLGGVVLVSGLIAALYFSGKNLTLLDYIQKVSISNLEQASALKMKIKSIQSGYYYAVTQEDPYALVRVKHEEEELAGMIREMQTFAPHNKILENLFFRFEEYRKSTDEVVKSLVEGRKSYQSNQDNLTKISELTKIINEIVDSFEERERAEFKADFKRARRISILTLYIVIASVFSAMVIAGLFIWFILKLNRRLTEANENLGKKVEELESFVYTVSHDLKSPLVSIQGMASIYLEDYGSRLEQKERYYLDRIIANSGIMEDLIQGLLMLSRVGRKQDKTDPVHLKAILSEILDLNQEVFKEKKIDVKVETGMPDLIFERLHLRQVFQNLIINAVKFMGSQPNPKIVIGGREYHDRVEIFVRDNGIGIDPAYHDRIFGVFQRLHEVEVEGTGVGLAIVKKIVDLAGGEIHVESRKGEGAAFYVTFPRSIRKAYSSY